MESSAGDWCLIESDPGVFTQLIKTFGVKGVQVEELWTIDIGIFENLRPVHGLIFLFKWMQNDEAAGPIVNDSRLEKIYFAKQVINNACATQAVLSILMNCDHPDVELGEELSQLKEFSMSFDPKMRGLTLSNSEVIRAAHNSMSTQTLFEFDFKTPDKNDDVYHFVSYVPIDGRLYELDGLRDGPVDLGPIGDRDWLEVVKPIIATRMDRYTAEEINFSLMAVVSNRKMVYERLTQAMLNNPHLMDSDAVDSEIHRLRTLMDQEDAKQSRYEVEMVRRKHNYFPFIIELLKILGEEKKLMPLYEKAKKRAEIKAIRKASNSKFNK